MSADEPNDTATANEATTDGADTLERLRSRTSGLRITELRDIVIDADGTARSQTNDPQIGADIDWPAADRPRVFCLSLKLRHSAASGLTAALYLDFGRGLSETATLVAPADGKNDVLFFLIVTESLCRLRIDPIDAAADFVLDAIAFAPVPDWNTLGTLIAQLGIDRIQADCRAVLAGTHGERTTARFLDALQDTSLLMLRDQLPAETAVTLMCGPTPLGSLTHHGGGAGSDLWSFGLADFACLCGLGDFAIVTVPVDGAAIRHDLPSPESAAHAEPLSLRGRLAPGLRLVDLWFATRRDLNLRFEGEGAGLVLDAWQCAPGDTRLVKLAADAPVGGATAIAAITLLNPFAPLLLVIRDRGGAIRAFDHIPFPSLARGGLHSAERDICGSGVDDIADMASLSADLLGLSRTRADHRDRLPATIVVDPAVHKWTEPILDRELLAWLAGLHGIAIVPGDPHEAAVVDALAGLPPVAPRAGTTLALPADTIPTLSALIRPIPEGAGAQTVTGGSALVDWDRQGAVHSIWMPPLGAWIDGLQRPGAKHVAPMLRVEGAARAAPPVSLAWPLAIALRDPPVVMGRRPPFEIASEVALPLLRAGSADDLVSLSVVVLCDDRLVSPIPLLESIVRQHGVAKDIEVLVCRIGTLTEPSLIEALDGLFPGRHGFVQVPRNAGRNDQIRAARGRASHDTVLIADAATILTDPRTVATLATMLAHPDVATAGCLVRIVGGSEPGTSFGGYCLGQADLRAAPGFVFAPLDLEALGAPMTVPVAANAMAAMALRRDLFDALAPHGSDLARPAVDDVLLGLEALETGFNLCTGAVSVHTDRAMPPIHQLARGVPFRLGAITLDRLVNASAIVQRVR